MFKAKLIESPVFYNYRKRTFIYAILGVLPVGVLVNYDTLPVWVTILGLLVSAGFFVLQVRTLNKIKSITGNSQIELDSNMLRVKNNKGQQGFEMDLDHAEKITIPKNYGMPKESILSPDEVSLNPKKNFIEISTGQQKKKFEFLMESYYMSTQFDNLIQSWMKKGYSIERV